MLEDLNWPHNTFTPSMFLSTLRSSSSVICVRWVDCLWEYRNWLSARNDLEMNAKFSWHIYMYSPWMYGDTAGSENFPAYCLALLGQNGQKVPIWEWLILTFTHKRHHQKMFSHTKELILLTLWQIVSYKLWSCLFNCYSTDLLHL